MAANLISPLIMILNFKTLVYFKELADRYTALLWWLRVLTSGVCIDGSFNICNSRSDMLSFSHSVFIQDKKNPSEVSCTDHWMRKPRGISGGFIACTLSLCHWTPFYPSGEPLFSRRLCVCAPQERIHGKSHFAVNSNLLFCRWNL